VLVANFGCARYQVTPASGLNAARLGPVFEVSPWTQYRYVPRAARSEHESRPDTVVLTFVHVLPSDEDHTTVVCATVSSTTQKNFLRTGDQQRPVTTELVFCRTVVKGPVDQVDPSVEYQ
jgi:hypothetical protein